MIHSGEPARDFEYKDLDGNSHRLSELKGKKILLSFLRNGACALCNLRVHSMIKNYPELNGLDILAIFESKKEDMLPYVGQQKPPFALIPDPEAGIYSLYDVEVSQEKVQSSMDSAVVHGRVQEASAVGFSLTPQEGSNFFRMPADFLIDEDFKIHKAFYSSLIGDHIDLEEIKDWSKTVRVV
ncbi:redoxin [Leptospira langatensis]|uniref:Redoxin n=1 Tax=Leptospira langatensis TaxID=2484983 RepID=A0A5F1ZVA7_9LEPT|nr:redoxin domain-containing protein [Leptospira langatensis]TGK01346.1 redoxin [Leptospira langatensis]TGL42202.1 redoxin [Leptospira langatensis]